MTKVRAQKGGEQGVNGEWYEGGQYLPSSKNTIKGEQGKGQQKDKTPKPRKQEIAPYKWEVSDKTSIWRLCGTGYYTQFTQTGYSKETGSQGYIEIFPSPVWEKLPNEEKEKIEAMVKAWNDGQRWV